MSKTQRAARLKVARAVGVAESAVHVGPGGAVATVGVIDRELENSPRTWLPQEQQTGWERARQLVNAAVGDPIVRKSPDALQLLAVINDILHESTPDDWPAAFIQKTDSGVRKWRGHKQHARTHEALQWVREHWQAKRDEYSSKTEFARDYCHFVAERFRIKEPAERTMCETWLKGL